MADVTGPGLFGIPGGRKPKKPTKIPSRPIRVLRAGAAAGLRGAKSPWSFVGASVLGGAWEYFDLDTKLADWQFRDLERARRIADREVREKAAKIRAERLAAAQRALQENQQATIDIPLGRYVDAPDPSLLPRGYATGAPAVPVTYPTGGTPKPPSRPGLKVPRVAPIPAPQSSKAAWWAKVRAAATSPVGRITLGALASAAFFSGGKGKKQAATDFPAPAEPDLTPFEDYSVFSGNVGGAFYEGEALGDQLESDLAPAARSAACEKIEPRRTPGECRQGWFSETPGALYLKEWSRRPCK